MKTTAAIAPSWSVMRLVKGAPEPGKKRKGFPVHEELETKLATAAPLDEPHAVARHVCAVLSGWAYSDADTVSMIMSRLGLKDCRVRCFDVANNALLIRSTAFLVQSADGRVALMAYRGTDPFDVSTWAVDADVNRPAILTPGNVRAGGDGALVHAGFYRNQRATWFELVGALKRAMRAESILDEADEAALLERRRRDARTFAGREEEAPPARRPLEALYVTGHSLGAAMATIAAYKIAADADYEDFRRVLKQVYLFAPPMVGDRGFERLWDRTMLAEGITLDGRVFAHTYARDVVPHVPPQGATRYVHVGKHYASATGESDAPGANAWVKADAPTQCSVYDMARAVEPLLFGHITWRELLPGIGGIVEKVVDTVASRPLSFADHVPTNYVVCSQPPGVNTEFGDDF